MLWHIVSSFKTSYKCNTLPHSNFYLKLLLLPRIIFFIIFSGENRWINVDSGISHRQYLFSSSSKFNAKLSSYLFTKKTVTKAAVHILCSVFYSVSAGLQQEMIISVAPNSLSKDLSKRSHNLVMSADAEVPLWHHPSFSLLQYTSFWDNLYTRVQR